MIVYRDIERIADPGTLLAECATLLRAIAYERTVDHALTVRLLVDFGELETAVADMLFPAADDISAIAELWRRAAMAIGRLFVASWLKAGSERLKSAAVRALSRIEPLGTTFPHRAMRLRVPEGYAYYALYPETYVAASRLFLNGRERGTAVCVGIRSIGTSLSAVVGATLELEGWGLHPLTLRPRGDPFRRRPVLTRELAHWLERQEQTYFLVIDEGPGLSGSSLCGVADVISELGVPDARIVLFPGWSADGRSFNSEASRRRWHRHARFCCSFEEAWLARGILGADVKDLSAGAWRRGCYADSAHYPAVHPQHERRKYLATLSSGEQVLFKFAGLGRYGAAKYARAERLAAAGFTPPVLGVRDGFLMQRFVRGRPLRRADADEYLLRRVARYLAHLRRHPVEETSVGFASLVEMIEVNVSEGLGSDCLSRLGDLERFRPLVANAPALAMDGRMMPHEWLATDAGILKTDAIDHHDDHFVPGPQDIAWDVAGFAAEFGLSSRTVRDFAESISDLSGDRGLRARLPFYEIAYLACRLGYATLAAQSLAGCDDGPRMAALAGRYRRRLRLSIARL